MILAEWVCFSGVETLRCDDDSAPERMMRIYIYISYIRSYRTYVHIYLTLLYIVYLLTELSLSTGSSRSLFYYFQCSFQCNQWVTCIAIERTMSPVVLYKILKHSLSSVNFNNTIQHNQIKRHADRYRLMMIVCIFVRYNFIFNTSSYVFNNIYIYSV